MAAESFLLAFDRKLCPHVTSLSLSLSLSLSPVVNADVSSFWHELPHAMQTDLPLGKLLTLPYDAPILGLRDLGSSLYLREVYDVAYEKIKAKLAGAHRKGVLVLGTPGSGQT